LCRRDVMLRLDSAQREQHFVHRLQP
jgi:hypothetical protein